MEIADHPTQARGARGIAQRDFENRLGLLSDCVNRGSLPEKERPVRKRLIEIKTKFAAIARGGAPASLRESGPIHFEVDTGNSIIESDRSPDDLHTRQNKKYRCAIGRMAAGSQRRTTPSALTV